MNFPLVKNGFGVLRINTSDCKRSVEDFRNNGYKVVLESIETPIGINAQVIDPSDLLVTNIKFKQESDIDAKFVKE